MSVPAFRRAGPNSAILTFLIADVRGYTAFTRSAGDEAAARLAAAFAEIVREGVEAFGGEVVELRGDEALAVFGSARSALRAASVLQQRRLRLDAPAHSSTPPATKARAADATGMSRWHGSGGGSCQAGDVGPAAWL